MAAIKFCAVLHGELTTKLSGVSPSQGTYNNAGVYRFVHPCTKLEQVRCLDNDDKTRPCQRCSEHTAAPQCCHNADDMTG